MDERRDEDPRTEAIEGMANPKDLDAAERDEFLKAMEKGFELESTRRGELKTGTITSLGKEYALIDLGGKSEGLLALEELRAEDGSLPELGAAVEAYIVSTGSDGIILSRRLAKGMRSKEFLQQAAESRIPVEGRVTGRNKGGFEVEVSGVRGFCPIGQIELRFCEDPDVHLNQKYNFVITKYEEAGHRTDLVLSRRKLLEAEAQAQAEELKKTLAEGDVVPGTVTKLMDFGAFVDLGGLEGLLPISELSHGHVDKIGDVLSVGEEIHVQILALDFVKNRISLSLKRLEADPWSDAMLQFPEGSRVTGRVVRLQPFGAFVELIPGVDGLIHVSQMNTPDRVNHPRDVLKEGQDVLVDVISVDPSQRRIGLSRVPADGEFGEVPVSGAVIEGKVEKVESFGVFVILGPGRKGLVPNAEMGTPRGTDHRKDYPPGTPIKVEVLEVTENGRRIRLSRKSALESAERADFVQYVAKDGEQSPGGFGTLADLLGKKTKG